MSKAHHFNTDFVDLPPESFPFTVRFFNRKTGELLSEVKVEGPGALHVPAMGVPTKVTIIWPDGQIAESE